MAASQLGLYNSALLLVGQRKLTGLTEEREPRHLLDDVYDLGAIEYCLEIVKPKFASVTVKLDSPATSSVHGLDSVHTLPTTYLTNGVVGVYSDDKLDQPIERYFVEGNTLVCEYDTVYLRYIDTAAVTTFTYWSQSFTRVVASYLAREICIKLAPSQYEDISALFVDRVEVAQGLSSDSEPENRSSGTTVTLTNDWRHVYNDALQVMGLEDITSNTDDSNRRSKLDRALDSSLVADLLEVTGWSFALSSTRSNYDPAIEPAWGYQRAHAHPSDMHRLEGIWHDEYMQSPLKAYNDEGGYFYTDYDEFYLEYVSTSFLTNPTQWPAHFRKLVAAKMATDAAASLKGEGADTERSKGIYDERESNSKSIDVMTSPPRKLASGNWVKARFQGRSNRDRP
jgi:hypothetical protein